MAKRYWLMKTEPDTFSFDDLIKRKNHTEPWDGVRNYQARNLMRDQFQKGDRVLFYHSRIDEPAVVGIAEVVREAYPDHTALDKKGKYFDPKSAEIGESRWVMVDVKAKQRLSRPVTLKEIKAEKALSKMLLIKRGMRLSVQPVAKSEFEHILKLGKPKAI